MTLFERKHDYAEVVRLHRESGLIGREIAERLEIPEGTVLRILRWDRDGRTSKRDLRRRRAEREARDAERLNLAHQLIVVEGQSYKMTAVQLRMSLERLMAAFPGHEWSPEQRLEAAIMSRQLNRLPNRLARTDIHIPGSTLPMKRARDAA